MNDQIKQAMQKFASPGGQPAAVLASQIIPQLLGGVVGHNYGKQQAARGEEYGFGLPQVGSLFLPGGTGYQIGRAVGHNAPKSETPKKKESVKHSSFGANLIADLVAGAGNHKVEFGEDLLHGVKVASAKSPFESGRDLACKTYGVR